VTLRQVTSELTKRHELLPPLDAFSGHRNIAVSGHRDDRPDDGEIARIRHQVADEGAVGDLAWRVVSRTPITTLGRRPQTIDNRHMATAGALGKINLFTSLKGCKE
jgi:hypothetical protein